MLVSVWQLQVKCQLKTINLKASLVGTTPIHVEHLGFSNQTTLDFFITRRKRLRGFSPAKFARTLAFCDLPTL